MRVLAVDTATPYLVLGTLEAELALRVDRGHNARLAEAVRAFLKETGTEPEALQAVVAGQGPGSYTGLRVGLAFAQGLARALGIPAVGVDTLAAVAARGRGTVVPGLTARNRQVYAAGYRTEAEPRLEWGPEKLDLGAYLARPGCHLLDLPPSGRALARLGLARLRAGERGFRPHYL